MKTLKKHSRNRNQSLASTKTTEATLIREEEDLVLGVEDGATVINRHSIIVTTTLSAEALKGAKNHQQLIKTE